MGRGTVRLGRFLLTRPSNSSPARPIVHREPLIRWQPGPTTQPPFVRAYTEKPTLTSGSRWSVPLCPRRQLRTESCGEGTPWISRGRCTRPAADSASWVYKYRPCAPFSRLFRLHCLAPRPRFTLPPPWGSAQRGSRQRSTKLVESEPWHGSQVGRLGAGNYSGTIERAAEVSPPSNCSSEQLLRHQIAIVHGKSPMSSHSW
jgi:hypothetical protein